MLFLPQRAIGLSTTKGYSGYGAEQGEKVYNFSICILLGIFGFSVAAQARWLYNIFFVYPLLH